MDCLGAERATDRRPGGATLKLGEVDDLGGHSTVDEPDAHVFNLKSPILVSVPEEVYFDLVVTVGEGGGQGAYPGVVAVEDSVGWRMGDQDVWIADFQSAARENGELHSGSFPVPFSCDERDMPETSPPHPMELEPRGGYLPRFHVLAPEASTQVRVVVVPRDEQHRSAP